MADVPDAQQVQIVNFPKLFGTLLLAILAAIAIVMGLSQITGYNMYTGEELPSHVAERLREKSEPTYQECLDDPDTTFKECQAFNE